MFIPATKAASQPASFTTDEDGYFAFPKGLGVGTYRIFETSPDPNYENIYSENAYTFEFEVVDRNVQISLYNPKKLTLDLEKAAADTQAPLSGAAFALKEGKRATTLTATTNSEGKASFSGIGSGVYTLSETEAAARLLQRTTWRPTCRQPMRMETMSGRRMRSAGLRPRASSLAL